ALIDGAAGVVRVLRVAAEAVDLVARILLEGGDDRIERAVRRVRADPGHKKDHRFVARSRRRGRAELRNLGRSENTSGRTVRREGSRRTVVPTCDEGSRSNDPEGEDRGHAPGAERASHG